MTGHTYPLSLFFTLGQGFSNYMGPGTPHRAEDFPRTPSHVRNYRGCSRCSCTWARGSWGPVAGVFSCPRKISARGEGAWRRRLVTYPDNFTVLSVVGRSGE